MGKETVEMMMSYSALSSYELSLCNEWVEKAEFGRMGAKTTICLLTLKNGFEIVGTSACVDPSKFEEEIGRFYALKDALRKLNELDGFYKQTQGV